MKLNAEKIIFIIVPLYLLVLVLGKGLNSIVYSILSLILGISMLYLALKLLYERMKERKNL